MHLDPLQSSILKSNINFYIGSTFLGTCALFAAVLMIEAGYGMNPIVEAFEATVYKQSTYIPTLP